MADPHTLHLDGLLDRIDRTLYHHEQLSQWDDPDPGGSIYPQQVERERLAAGGTRVTWIPQIADPEHPTTAELRSGIDLTGFLAGPVTGLPSDTPSTTDHIGDEEWGRQQIVTMRQATFTPTGPPHFPAPSLSSTLPTPLGDVEDWENGDVIATLKRRPWWRRIWRRRG